MPRERGATQHEKFLFASQIYAELRKCFSEYLASLSSESALICENLRIIREALTASSSPLHPAKRLLGLRMTRNFVFLTLPHAGTPWESTESKDDRTREQLGVTRSKQDFRNPSNGNWKVTHSFRKSSDRLKLFFVCRTPKIQSFPKLFEYHIHRVRRKL